MSDDGRTSMNRKVPSLHTFEYTDENRCLFPEETRMGFSLYQRGNCRLLRSAYMVPNSDLSPPRPLHGPERRRFIGRFMDACKKYVPGSGKSSHAYF